MTFWPSISVITSPPVEYCSPSIVFVPVAALQARPWPPACSPVTFVSSTPPTRSSSSATEAGIVWTETPRYACSTLPLAISCAAIDLTVFEGIAKPTPSLPPESLRDLGVDADHLAARVEQRAARVAVVDRGVGLDRVVDREAVRRLHLPVQGADDAARDGLLEPEGAADRDHAVADLHAARVAERERVKKRLRRVDLDHGEIGRRVGADDRRLVGVAVPEPDRHRLRAVDDVVVRDDVAVRVDDEARALRTAARCCRRTGSAESRRDRDLDDALGGRCGRSGRP